MHENPHANLDRLKQMAISYLIRRLFGTGPVAQLAIVALSAAATGGLGNCNSGGNGGANSTATLQMLQGMMSMVCT